VNFKDNKMDVMEVTLTPHGISLLTQGKWNPEYYSFSDEGVIYDNEYTGDSAEEQNDIEDRIVLTPSSETQVRYHSCDVSKSEGTDNPLMRDFSRVLPLGRIDPLSGVLSVPLWQLRVHQVTSDNTVSTVNERPQIEVDDVEYYVSLHAKEEETNESQIFDENRYELEDGSFVMVRDNYILLDIEEIASEFKNKNFDLELYEVETDSSGEEHLISLAFFKDPQLVRDDILLASPIEYDEMYKETDKQLVDYYLDIDVDHNIDNEKLCKHVVPKNDNNNIYLQDQGIVMDEQAGKDCTMVDDNSINNHYEIRKEEDLGDTC